MYQKNSSLSLGVLRFVMLMSIAGLGVASYAQGEPSTGEYRNLAPNSSFEYCSEPSMADYWGCPHWGIQDPQWILRMDEWRRRFGIDEQTAYHGRRSLRVDYPFDKPQGNGLVPRSCYLGLVTGRQYTVSAYLKSEPAGMRVGLLGKEVTLTKEWKRYELPWVRKTASVYEDMLNIVPLSKGVMWVDAIQVEEGEKATGYGASVTDDQLASKFTGKKPVRTAVPELILPVIEEDIVLDGVLNEACWQKAQKVELVLTSGAVAKEPTTGYLLQNRKGIYIGVECADSKARENQCRYMQRDGDIWNDPCVELFVSPGDDQATLLSSHIFHYYHFIVNQAGVQGDRLSGDLSWDGDWSAATKTGTNSWAAEIFLPFSELGMSGGMNEWWGFNLCRENHNEREYSCWSPTYGSFHMPERFGKVRISRDSLRGYDYQFEGVRLERLGADQGVLRLKVRQGQGTGAGGSYRVEVKGKEGSNGWGRVYGQDLRLGKDGVGEVCVEGVPATGKAVYDVLLKDKDGVLHHEILALPIPSLLSVKSRYTLLTSEPEVILLVESGIAGKGLKDKRLKLKVIRADEGGKPAIEREIRNVKTAQDVSLPSGKLSNGMYQVKVELVDEAGKILAQAEDTFRKLPPQDGEVKIDKFRRMILVDGIPTIVCGLHLEHMPQGDELEYLKASGFQEIAIWHDYKNVEMNKQLIQTLKKAGELGIKFMLQMSSPGDAKEVGEMREYLRQIMPFKALMSIMTFDEVFCYWTDPKWLDKYPFVAQSLDELNAAFPYRLIKKNEAWDGLSWLAQNQLRFPGPIISVDYYALFPGATMAKTTLQVQTMQAMSKQTGQPMWFYILGGGGYAHRVSREFNVSEYEFSVYTCLINGVSGIWFFADYPRVKSHWEKMKELNGEIKTLTPVLASPTAEQSVKCQTPEIQTLVKEYDGALYIIALNETIAPVKATFALTGKIKKSGQVLFEDRKVRIKDAVFEDHFDGYQRHVYQLRF